MDKFDTYVTAGRELIEQHPDFGSLTREGDEEDRANGYETAATDQIATILHGLLGRKDDSGLAQDVLDRAFRCFQGDYEDMVEEPKPVVVVVRDSDFDNEYHTFGEPVSYYDIDCGRMNLRDPVEYEEWARSHRESADEFERDGRSDVAEFIRDTVNNYGPDA